MDALEAGGEIGAFLDGGLHREAASVRVAAVVAEGVVSAAGEEEDASEGDEQQSGVSIHIVDSTGVPVGWEGALGARLPLERIDFQTSVRLRRGSPGSADHGPRR